MRVRNSQPTKYNNCYIQGRIKFLNIRNNNNKEMFFKKKFLSKNMDRGCGHTAVTSYRTAGNPPAPPSRNPHSPDYEYAHQQGGEDGGSENMRNNTTKINFLTKISIFCLIVPHVELWWDLERTEKDLNWLGGQRATPNQLTTAISPCLLKLDIYYLI